MPDTELEIHMTPDLEQFTQLARAHPRMEFHSLMGLVFRPEGLLDSFRRLPGNKAAGVDGMKKGDYAGGLEERIAELSARLRRLGYRPQPVRRVYIPKAHGGRRPLGIPTVRSYCTSYKGFGDFVRERTIRSSHYTSVGSGGQV